MEPKKIELVKKIDRKIYEKYINIIPEELKHINENYQLINQYQLTYLNTKLMLYLDDNFLQKFKSIIDFSLWNIELIKFNVNIKKFNGEITDYLNEWKMTLYNWKKKFIWLK